jgi:hypothetical protein
MLFRRMRFNYTLKDVVAYLLRFGCCMKKKYMIFNKKMRKHALFLKGEDKLLDELDCITFLKSIR